MSLPKFEFFQQEYNKFENFLLKFSRNPNELPFIDENFHPSKKIIEKKIKFDLYGPDIKWERIDDIYPAPLFKEELIAPKYMKQGKLGDCYLISALSRVAHQPYLIKSFFEKKKIDLVLGEIEDSINLKCGAVVVYLQAFGRKTPILIDTRIPVLNGVPVFAKLSENSYSPWFCLVEKAYAKLKGSYSNIKGGYLTEPIYNVSGYYQKMIVFNKWDTTKKKTLIQTIIDYHKYGSVMDATIHLNNPDTDTINEYKDHNLVQKHSYLIRDIVKYKDDYFFYLRNPWGRKEWKGDYSIDSSLWTPELKAALNKRPAKGSFWMISNDFFHYFTNVNISKPLNPNWIVRVFHLTLYKGAFFIDLDKKPNFAIQITDPNAPSNTKIRFRILVERCFPNEIQDNNSIILIYCAHVNGRKLTRNAQFHESSSKVFCYSSKLIDKTDIITFSIDNLSNNNEEEAYIRVSCEYDFKLYNIDNPDKLFPRGENFGAIFDNFDPNSHNQASKLKPRNVNDQILLWFDDNDNFDDDNNNNDDDELRTSQILNIIKERQEKMDSHHYSNEGAQINLDLFNFSGKVISKGPKSINYLISHKRSGIEYTAKIIVSQFVRISKEFSKELWIARSFKFPSIANLIGYSETDFEHHQHPVLITQYFKRRSLADVLSLQEKEKLHQNGYNDWNNTKKMICLIGIALGMNYIHKRNFIHRNLKCSNIFLDDNLYPKIGDFSNSTSSDTKINQTNMSSNPSIIAPELIKNLPYSFPIDVFSFALICYHVLSNHEPKIPSLNEENLHIKIAKGKRPGLSYLNPKYHNFIKDMWNDDPDKRPNFDQIVSSLINDRENCWLDEVNEIEVENYLHQFGITLKKQNPSILVTKIISELYTPINATIPQRSLTEILSDETIPTSFKNIISSAKNLTNSTPKEKNEIEYNRDIFFKVGYEFYLGSNGNYNCLNQDMSHAFYFLKYSSQLGHIEAIYCLATIFLLDGSTENSKKIALKLINIAADFEFPQALMHLATLYNNGGLVDQNILLAAVFFKYAADKGQEDAIVEYAKFLRNVIDNGIEKRRLNELISNAKETIEKEMVFNMNRFVVLRYVSETIEDESAAIYVCRKYYEKAANLKINEAIRASEELRCKYIDYPAMYFDELC